MAAVTHCHAMAFFQWRSKYSSRTDKNQLKSIIDSRTGMLSALKQVMETKIKKSKNAHKTKKKDDDDLETFAV